MWASFSGSDSKMLKFTNYGRTSVGVQFFFFLQIRRDPLIISSSLILLHISNSKKRDVRFSISAFYGKSEVILSIHIAFCQYIRDTNLIYWLVPTYYYQAHWTVSVIQPDEMTKWYSGFANQFVSQCCHFQSSFLFF